MRFTSVETAARDAAAGVEPGARDRETPSGWPRRFRGGAGQDGEVEVRRLYGFGDFEPYVPIELPHGVKVGPSEIRPAEDLSALIRESERRRAAAERR